MLLFRQPQLHVINAEAQRDTGGPCKQGLLMKLLQTLSDVQTVETLGEALIRIFFLICLFYIFSVMAV